MNLKHAVTFLLLLAAFGWNLSLIASPHPLVALLHAALAVACGLAIAAGVGPVAPPARR